MKPYNRSERVGGLIKQVIAEMLKKRISDPRIADVTLTGIKLSRDLRVATIYFSITGDKACRQEALNGLNRACGFFKRELAQQLDLRYMPDLKFFYDESIDYGARIEQLLSQVNQSDESNS
ncbi:MAG: 30S ribosome-binding factor RbfA [Desulfobacteraceae bacterium]|nr:30S ribosome-binding factor RbfA [Desulfobacteraceae bacterium]